MVNLKELVGSVERAAEGRLICLYTGHNTDPKCAEHLAKQMCVRGHWVYYEVGADSEPPVYVASISPEVGEEDISRYTAGLMRMVYQMCMDGVSGDIDQYPVYGTDDIIEMDRRASNDDVVLFVIYEGYEEFLSQDIDDEPYVPPIDKNVSKYKDYSTEDLLDLCTEHDLAIVKSDDPRVTRMRALIGLKQAGIIS